MLKNTDVLISGPYQKDVQLITIIFVHQAIRNFLIKQPLSERRF
jgi:hypothetical protein